MFEGKPSVVASIHFHAENDAQALRKAMKGMGTNEKEIIDIVCARSYKQLTEIADKYKQSFGRVLLDDLKSELSGKFEKVIEYLFLDHADFDAYIIHKAIKGLGTDETAIIEVMCTRTDEELKHLKVAYKKKYGHELEKDLSGDTSGDFKRFLVSLSSADRDKGPADHAKAEHEAKKLYDSGEGKLGTDEETWNTVMAVRSWPQLDATFAEYKKKYNKKHGIQGAINSEFSGHIKEAYLAIATTVEDTRAAYFADKLYQSMKGAGTNDDQLIRLIVSRAQLDLTTVKGMFMRRYKKSLEDFIEHDTSGDYRKALMTLTKGNVH